jgi:hypothetical protein
VLSVGGASGPLLLVQQKKEIILDFSFSMQITFSKLADKCMYKLQKGSNISWHMSIAHLNNIFIRSHNGLIDSTLDKTAWGDFDLV